MFKFEALFVFVLFFKYVATLPDGKQHVESKNANQHRILATKPALHGGEPFLDYKYCFPSSRVVGSSIQCYECSSVNNSMCIDPSSYDEETLHHFLPYTTCGEGVFTDSHHDFFCRKIVQTILHKHYEPEVRVTRTCGWVRHHRECYKADNEDHLETVCQCFTDHCNGSTALGTSVLWLFGIMALKFYF